MDAIRALRAFVRVVEYGSFTRAANALGVSRSVVTKHVQWLESLLKASLLTRTTHSVALTRNGAVCYRRALRLLAALDALGASMVDSHDEPEPRASQRAAEAVSGI